MLNDDRCASERFAAPDNEDGNIHEVEGVVDREPIQHQWYERFIDVILRGDQLAQIPDHVQRRSQLGGWTARTPLRPGNTTRRYERHFLQENSEPSVMTVVYRSVVIHVWIVAKLAHASVDVDKMLSFAKCSVFSDVFVYFPAMACLATRGRRRASGLSREINESDALFGRLEMLDIDEIQQLAWPARVRIERFVIFALTGFLIASMNT